MFKKFLCAAAAFVLAFSSCKQKSETVPPDPELVASLSGGVIERIGPVSVEFTQAFDTEKPLPNDVFRLEPAAKGAVSWANPFTLTFVPEKPLKAGTVYTAHVNPVKLAPAPVETPEENQVDDENAFAPLTIPLKPFSFTFTTVIPSLTVSLDPVVIEADGKALVSGTVAAERGAANADVEKVLGSISTPQAKVDVGAITWEHSEDAAEHRFALPPLPRTDDSYVVAVAWTGKPLDIEGGDTIKVEIPGTKIFSVTGIRMLGSRLTVYFSSPLKPSQDLRGYASLSGNTNIRYSITGSSVEIFGIDDKDGLPDGSVLVIQDLPDIYGNVLTQPVNYTVSYGWELPELRFAGNGTILPTSQGTQMVAETKNLSGLLVEAFRIYGDNMVQFLQTSDLSSSDNAYELDRAGEPVWTKAFDFPWKDADKNAWVRRGLDLSELSRKYPDGMFHIRMSFRPRHVKYVCEKNHADYSGKDFPPDSFPAMGNSGGERSNWDWWNNWDWDYSEYEWRLDPCHPLFYRNFYDHNITVGRNVLVSDLGLLAKKGVDGNWIASATNLKTAKGESGVQIDVLNYQGRALYRLKTDGAGLANFASAAVQLYGEKTAAPVPSGAMPGNQTPFFLVASGKPGRAYLKISDSQALAVSHFDLEGEKPATGLRGLIYGERGVWRPGDEIFLTFLLSDPLGTLPANHPVSFELEDPRGTVAVQKTYTSSVDGFYAMNCATAQDAPTGNWTARVKAGGAVFTKTVKIETVIPNRLRMDLDFGNKNYIETPNKVNLEAAWLYGAPGSSLRADISATFSAKAASFAGKADYSFADPSRTVSSERQDVWSGTLDEAGSASFNMQLNPGDAVPGFLSAHFMARVYEPSGAFSTEQFSKDFSPYKRYVGVRLPEGDAMRGMLLTDTDHRADLLLLDADGNPVKGKATLDCEIFKLEWRWWWEKGENEAASYAESQSRTSIAKGTAEIIDGKGAWKFNIKYPEWGRYLVLVRDAQGGHAAGKITYIDWPGWAGRQREGAATGAAAMLVLSPDKQQYNTGEKVKISFPSNKEAQALVVIEKGGSVLRKEWVQCSADSTSYTFTADAGMTPNIYVHVSLLQPHLQTMNDLPIRLYGVTPVFVEDPKTVLAPVITASDAWEPETEASFTVSEKQGRAMSYTVALVDEGLLGLTRYSLPNPRSVFYAREASFVKSWDLFADVMGAYSGQLETLLAIGGSDEIIDDGSNNTSRFKPVVRFFGPFTLKAGEKKTENFVLPQYIGALRVMVLAASTTAGGTNRAYGTAEKSVKVASDLMVFATVPRTLSPGDEAVIPVTVASYKDGKRDAQVSLQVAGAALQGASTATVSFDRAGEKTANFTIKAPASPGGVVKINAGATSPGLKAARQATSIAVRSTALPVTNSQLKLLPPGETWSTEMNFLGAAGTNEAKAEFSRLPPLNLEGRLDYLVRYPHGCIEQTTSAAFPQLYLEAALNLKADKLGEVRRNVNAAIERLRSFQVPGGGFSYWPGGESADDWGSTYAGHFLIEAKRAGYSVPADTLANFIAFQKGRAAGWASRDGSQLMQAYRLYTLALAGDADLGSMNRLRERDGLSTQARFQLAAAYWYAGQRDTARRLIQGQSFKIADYREYGYTYGSAFRDKAMILETLVLVQGDANDIKNLFEEMAKELSSERWLSTQEISQSLRAAMAYMKGAGDVKEITADWSFGSAKKSVKFSSQIEQVDLGKPGGSTGTFTVKNTSQAPLYARLAVRGLPEEGKEQPLSRGLAARVEYRSGGRAVDPASVAAGGDMEIAVTVANSRNTAIENIALVHQLPAGWEIINTRLDEGAAQDVRNFAYQDIRDDRVMTYFNLPAPGSSVTVKFTVNKTYGGTYFRPAIQAYAMYDESVAAVIPSVRE
jgi:uncharacterized protein YfaS (alpha-2-macroglobulin family)